MQRVSKHKVECVRLLVSWNCSLPSGARRKLVDPSSPERSAKGITFPKTESIGMSFRCSPRWKRKQCFDSLKELFPFLFLLIPELSPVGIWDAFCEEACLSHKGLVGRGGYPLKRECRATRSLLCSCQPGNSGEKSRLTLPRERWMNNSFLPF